MKLYYSPFTCSLASSIVTEEAGIPLELVRVDITPLPHRLPDGSDYGTVNPHQYVPALVLDDGQVLTEGVAILQFLGDLRPASGLVPPAGTFQRVRLQQWLTFVSSELHKVYSPWLFHAEAGEAAQSMARATIGRRLAWVETQLGQGPYLFGETFTAADAYLFTIVGWSKGAGVDLSPYPRLRAFQQRVSERLAVRRALQAHGMPVPAVGSEGSVEAAA
jgi:glutathione S-transferase